jgi:hypothetical protein
MRTKYAILTDNFSWMLPTKFWFILPNGFREEESEKISQSETRIACGGHDC